MVALVMCKPSDPGQDVLALIDVRAGDQGDHKGAPLPSVSPK